MKLALRSPGLLETIEPFVVATPENRTHFDLTPFDLRIRPDYVLDPLRLDAAPFLERLCHLDTATFGRQGMAMPRWILFDGGAISGGIVGFGRHAAALSPEARRLLDVANGDAGLIPLSMYIAMPAFEPGTWIGHNLCSVASQLPTAKLAGLGSLTKAIALRVFRTRVQVGAAQWDSPALHVHTKLGALRLVTAWTPAHSKPWTLTYSVPIDEAALRHLAGDRRRPMPVLAPEFWLHSDDHTAMRELQARIESGERFCIVGPPAQDDDARQRLPLARGWPDPPARPLP